MLLTPIVGMISSWSTLAIPVLFFLLRPQRLVKANWLLLVYSVLHFASDRINEFFSTDDHMLHQLSFVFVLLEYVVLAALLYMVLMKKRNRRWVLAGSALFAILAVLTWVRWGAGYYGSIRGTSVILLISYIMFFFLEWITAETFEPINTRPEFWMVTGALLYLAGNFFFFITIRNQFAESLLIHYLVNILRNACFVAAMVQSCSTGKNTSVI